MSKTKTYIYQRAGVVNTVWIDIKKPNSMDAKSIDMPVGAISVDIDPNNSNRFRIKSGESVIKVGEFDFLYTRDPLLLTEQDLTGTIEEKLAIVNGICFDSSSLNKANTDLINGMLNTDINRVIENQVVQGAMGIDNALSYGIEWINNSYPASIVNAGAGLTNALVVYEGVLNDINEGVEVLLRVPTASNGNRVVTLGLVLEDDLKNGDNPKYTVGNPMPTGAYGDYQIALGFGGSSGYYTNSVKNEVGMITSDIINIMASTDITTDNANGGAWIKIKLIDDNKVVFYAYSEGEYKKIAESVNGLPAGNYKLVAGLFRFGSAMYNPPILTSFIDNNSGDDTSNNLDISKKMVFSSVLDNYINVPSAINLKNSFSIFIKGVNGFSSSERLKLISAENDNIIGYRQSSGVLYFDGFEFLENTPSFTDSFILGFVYNADTNNFKVYKNKVEVHDYSPSTYYLNDTVSNILNIGGSSSSGWGYDGFNGNIRSVSIFDSVIDVTGEESFIDTLLPAEKTLNSHALWDDLTHYITAIDDKVHDLKKTGNTELTDINITIAEYGGN